MKSLQLLKAEKMLEMGMTDAEKYLEYRLGLCTKQNFIDFALIGNHGIHWVDYIKNEVTYDLFEFDESKSLNTNLLVLMNSQFYCFFDTDAIGENVWEDGTLFGKDKTDMEDDFEMLMFHERELFAELKTRIIMKEQFIKRTFTADHNSVVMDPVLGMQWK